MHPLSFSGYIIGDTFKLEKMWVAVIKVKDLGKNKADVSSIWPWGRESWVRTVEPKKTLCGECRLQATK